MNDLNDSELIALYHAGKLDGESMNQLERRALDDPFLADAMEGFSQVKKPRLHLKKDLRERLEKRLHKNKRRGILGQTSAWAAAAAIVLAVGATWFWFHEEKENRIVQNEVVKPAPVITQNDTVKQAIVSETPVIASAVPEKETVKQASRMQLKTKPVIQELPDSVVLGDVASVIFEPAKPAASAVGFSQAVVSDSQVRTKSLNNTLQGKVSGVMVAEAKRTDKVLLRGKVVSADDGNALPGVNLVLQGKNRGVVSDANGTFSIQADTDDVIDARYVGYEPSKKKISGSDTVLIALQPSHTSLSEVVVVGYGAPKSLKKAEPNNGWKAYREYLEKAAVASGSKGGRVVLEFSIDKNGIPADFSIIKTYSKEAAEKAEKILKSGSRWRAASTPKPERIRISIRFGAAKKQS